MSRIFTKLAVATAISLVAGLGLTGSVSPASAAEACPGGTPAENTNPANQAPVVTDDTAAVQAGSSVIVRVLSNDTDPDGDQLAVVSTKTSKGVTCIGAKGLIRYTPNVGKYDRTDTFTYGVTDGDNYRTGTVTLAVTGLKPLKPVLKKRLLLKPNGKVKQLARVAFTNPNSKRVLLFVEGMNTGQDLRRALPLPGAHVRLPGPGPPALLRVGPGPQDRRVRPHQRRPAQHPQRCDVLRVRRRVLRTVHRGTVKRRGQGPSSQVVPAQTSTGTRTPRLRSERSRSRKKVPVRCPPATVSVALPSRATKPLTVARAS